MKTLYKYIIMIAVAVTSFGCDNYDDRYSPEYAAVVRLSVYGERQLKVPMTGQAVTLDFKVMRSGFDINRITHATVTKMNEEEWTRYSNTYGIQRYYVIPDDCYTIGDQSGESTINLTFAPKESAIDSSLTIYSDKLQDFIDTLPPPIQAGAEWANVVCLPLTLTSNDGSVFAEQKVLILTLNYLN